MILTKDKGQRMWGGFGGEGGYGGSGGSGGGGYMPDLSNYVTLDFLKSITWWGRALPADSTDIVGALTGVTDITMTGAISGTTNLTMTGAISGATGLTLNNGAITGATTITASGLATVGSLRIGDAVLEWDNGNNALKIRKSTGANDAVNVYATGGVSALGYASGGGGGGATALTDLVDVATNSPSSGQGLVYDATAGKWKNATLFTSMSYTNNVLSVTVSGVTKQVTINSGGGGTGTVTSITAGAGLKTDNNTTGGTITTSGTIALTEAVQTAISSGAVAYGWGNHADAGYLTGITAAMVNSAYGFTLNGTSGQTYNLGSFLTGITAAMINNAFGFTISGSAGQSYSLATISVNASHGETAYGWGNHANAGYLTSSSLTGYATQTWVQQQGYLTSSAISDMATKTWVGQQGYLTSSSISDMATKTWVGQQGYITSSALNGYATQTWVGNNYVSISFFSRLFQAKNGSTNVNPNNTTSTIDSIKALFGFWTDQYISALGQGSGGSGGATTLAALLDTNISNPSNGQVLKYDSSTSKWINATMPSGSTTLAALTDTNISSPTNGQVLKYNSSTGKWVNADESGGGGGSGTVTSVTAGAGLRVDNNTSGGTITTSGTIGLTSAVMTNISAGYAAYLWGNHADAGYAKLTDLDGYIEETGNGAMTNIFEPYTNGSAQLGRSSFRFSYVYGQHGDFTDLVIGSIKLTYDSTNNALKVQKSDGTAANLYALGSVSALGFGGGPSSTSISQLTITESLNFPGSSDINYDTDDEVLYFTTAGNGFVMTGGYLEVNGEIYIENRGSDQGGLYLGGSRLYLDATRYIYGTGTHLYYWNGSTNIQIA